MSELTNCPWCGHPVPKGTRTGHTQAHHGPTAVDPAARVGPATAGTGTVAHAGPGTPSLPVTQVPEGATIPPGATVAHVAPGPAFSSGDGATLPPSFVPPAARAPQLDGATLPPTFVPGTAPITQPPTPPNLNLDGATLPPSFVTTGPPPAPTAAPVPANLDGATLPPGFATAAPSPAPLATVAHPATAVPQPPTRVPGGTQLHPGTSPGLAALTVVPDGGPGMCANCEKPLVDTRLGLTMDKYKIESLLGQGGMGRVYKAIHTQLGEPVVIKFLLASIARSPEARARFRREAVALARLRHPGIVGVLDFGEYDEAPYLVMEFLAGKALSGVLAADPEIALDRFENLFDKLLQVLEAAHAAGIVHRDLKPDNVMVLKTADREEHIKVLDFGLATDPKEQEKLTVAGQVFGTPQYMSPEQCQGQGVGPPTDIYAVGIMLYEALAGKIPFDGKGLAQLIAQHIYVNPPAMAERGLNRKLPPGLEPLVMRCLAKNADDRPTAPELRDLLGRALQGTDAAALMARAADMRVKAGGMTRDQRALSGAATVVPAMAGGGEQQSIALWGGPPETLTGLRDALAVAGFRPSIWAAQPPADLPADPKDPAAIKCVVISQQPGNAVDRVTALRAHATLKKVPIMVVDVPKGDQVPGIIRAGASDVALASVASEALCQKIGKLAKRGR